MLVLSIQEIVSVSFRYLAGRAGHCSEETMRHSMSPYVTPPVRSYNLTDSTSVISKFPHFSKFGLDFRFVFLIVSNQSCRFHVQFCTWRCAGISRICNH